MLKNIIKRLKVQWIYFLISRKHFVSKLVAAAPEKVIGALEDHHVDEVLKRLCDSRLADVVTIVEQRTGGYFKYTNNDEINLIVGSGPQKQEGWISTDIDRLNVIDKTSWARLLDYESVNRILAEHVLEHLTLEELFVSLSNVYLYLKPGGYLRLAVPDAFHPSRYYYNLVKPGGWETPFEHKLFIDHEMLSRLAAEVGFEVKLLEYFDEKGIFHGVNYNDSDGEILRCAKNNIGLDVKNDILMDKFYGSIPDHLKKQFQDRGMTYTSLIADLIKPATSCKLRN